MSQEETFLNIDTNVDTTTDMEILDTDNVEDAPIVSVHKPKKSKRVSSRGVTKGSLVDDDTFSPEKLSIDNDSSDNVVNQTLQLTYLPMRQSNLFHLTNCLIVMTYLSNQFKTTNLSPKPQRQTLRNVFLMI